MRLSRILEDVCPAGRVVLPAPLDWVLWEVPRARVRQPDLMVLPVSVLDEQRVTVPPLLAVEILSPGSEETDLVTKPAEYARAGTPHVWVVDPTGPTVLVLDHTGAEPVEVRRAGQDDELVVEHPFPVGFRPVSLVAV